MTEEDKLRLAQAKREATEALAAESLGRYRLDAVDPRLSDYVAMVAGDPAGHNLFEQLAVLRFLRMCKAYGLNATEVWKFAAFYESLMLPGKAGDQRYALTPVQYFQYASIFGFWRPDGRRATRTAILFVPRKFSKTTSSAALALYDLLYGDANGEAYVGANSADQAKKCFDAIRGALRHLDPKERRYRINEMQIKSLRKDRRAFAQCLTANARTKDGLNASLMIMDEYSQARDANLYNVLTTSMGVRDNPLSVIITTASDAFDGPFYSMLDGCKRDLLKELSGGGGDDSLFAHIFEPDLGDDEGSPATWAKVHPHLGVTVSLDFYRHEWAAAQRDGAEAMLAFRTKLLNVYAENATRSWIGGDAVRKVMIPMDLTKLRKPLDAMVAIDLSESDDFSAVTIGMYNTQGAKYYFYTSYFFPAGALPGHPNESLYRTWAAAGHLILTEGDCIDYMRIVDHINWAARHVRIKKIGADRWRFNEIKSILRTIVRSQGGDPDAVIVDVPQTNAHFSAPTESFEHGLKTGHVYLNDNPINAFCFANAVLDVDRSDNIKPVKRETQMSKKIDGVITTLMAQKLFLDAVRYG